MGWVFSTCKHINCGSGSIDFRIFVSSGLKLDFFLYWVDYA